MAFNVPLILRGTVINGAELEHGGRGGAARFTTPDILHHLDALPLRQAARMADLYELSFADVLDYLDALGERLALDRNPWLQEAFELSCRTSGLGAAILTHIYQTLGTMFSRQAVSELAERTIGLGHLDGWVKMRLASGIEADLRAFGARTVHVIAGNVPSVAALSIVRNAMTRGDAIIKTPSNDPATATAIARTMIDMAPHHPLTRHLSVAYWKGGDDHVESRLYQPEHIEKIVAWGGMASMSHIGKYIRPGIELVALDPKLSSTIIGAEAFENAQTTQQVADALAIDVGTLNQEGCVNARVVYVQSGTGPAGVARLNRLGALVWDALQALPPQVSGPAVRMEQALHEELDALRMGADAYYKVIGGGREGAVIVSQIDEPVDFAAILANRVVNLVPVDDIDSMIASVTGHTQTIGIFPESLKQILRDRLAIQGAQRLVTLGQAWSVGNHGIQDGIEPLRRMCRWIVDESKQSLF